MEFSTIENGQQILVGKNRLLNQKAYQETNKIGKMGNKDVVYKIKRY